MCGVLLAAAMLAGGCGQAADSKTQEPSGGQETGQDVAAQSDAETKQEEAQRPDGLPVQMPAFTTTDLAGNEVTESIFGEKDLTVLNIWGTFCSPCVREMPELGEWEKELPENVQLLGLVVDIEGEDDTLHKDLAMEIADKAGAEFTQLLVNMDFAPVVSRVVGVPTTLFIDKEGKIVGDPIVGADVAGYRQFVEDYLSEQ